MPRRVIVILTLLFAVSVSAEERPRLPIAAIQRTLSYISVDTADVGFRPGWVDRDSFRLNIVDNYMRRPLGLSGFLDAAADSLVDSTRGVGSQYRFMRSWLVDGRRLPDNDSATWGSAVDAYFAQFARSRRACDSLAHYIEITLREMAAALKSWDIGRFAPDEQAFLRDTFRIFLESNEKDVDLPLEALDSLQNLQEQLALRFKALSDRLSPRDLALGGARVVSAYERLVRWLERNPELIDQLARCDLITLFRDIKTPLGRVAVRGSGNDRYEGFYDLIIDLGGDDEYRLSRADEPHSQIIIDCGGHDLYLAQSDLCFGAGRFSTGILDDWAGNDFYRADEYSLGCGLFGVGILRDRAGDDTYQGNLATQGAAAFGVGLLLDDQGRDSYTASIYSQGFGFIMGAAALVDRQGNDRYAVGWKYGDILRYEDHYLSLSQGFGYGLRPHFSGGIGLLIDGDGNDQYSADIFGQGASYWYGIGGLVDYRGNDTYVAYQYAQGAATHMCLAALHDYAGDDLYSSKGVSQGCGHDIAFALLLDADGNDQYSATDLSQAAGSANGIGMLIDLRGDDGHIARVASNTHGYGNPRREFGSIGLFLDLGGKDDYRGQGRDNSVWIGEGRWGIGLDNSGDDR